MKKILGLNVFVGLMAFVGVAAVALWIAHRYFGLLSYPGLSSQDVDKVAAEYDKRFKIVTRAQQEDGLIRGIYDMGGVLYYYRYMPGKDYFIYPVLAERYTTDPSFIDNVKMLYP